MKDSDDALIEAMARAMFKDDQTCRLEIAKAIFEVCKPIIAAQERERLATMFEALPDMNLNAPDIGYIIRNMAAIRETGDE